LSAVHVCEPVEQPLGPRKNLALANIAELYQTSGAKTTSTNNIWEWSK